MPLLVIAREGKPVISIQCTDDHDALTIAKTSGVPDAACQSIALLTQWLALQLPPSGVYTDNEKADLALLQIRREQDARLLRLALATTGMTQVALAAALGLSDPRKDGSAIRKVLLGKNAMGGSTRRALAYVLKHGVITAEDEQHILDQLGCGEWKTMNRKQLRDPRLSGSGHGLI